MASPLGPIIGIVGKGLEGIGEVVHALPVAGPVTEAAAKAAEDLGTGLVAGVGQTAAGTVTGAGIGVGTVLGGVGQAVTDLTTALGPSHTAMVVQPPAEPGQTTSEFKMTAVKSLVLAVFGALAAYGVGVPQSVQTVVVAVVPIAIAILGAAYSISRGLRKRGTA